MIIDFHFFKCTRSRTCCKEQQYIIQTNFYSSIRNYWSYNCVDIWNTLFGMHLFFHFFLNQATSDQDINAENVWTPKVKSCTFCVFMTLTVNPMRSNDNSDWLMSGNVHMLRQLWYGFENVGSQTCTWLTWDHIYYTHPHPLSDGSMKEYKVVLLCTMVTLVELHYIMYLSSDLSSSGHLLFNSVTMLFIWRNDNPIAMLITHKNIGSSIINVRINHVMERPWQFWRGHWEDLDKQVCLICNMRLIEKYKSNHNSLEYSLYFSIRIDFIMPPK